MRLLTKLTAVVGKHYDCLHQTDLLMPDRTHCYVPRILAEPGTSVTVAVLSVDEPTEEEVVAMVEALGEEMPQ